MSLARSRGCSAVRLLIHLPCVSCVPAKLGCPSRQLHTLARCLMLLVVAGAGPAFWEIDPICACRHPGDVTMDFLQRGEVLWFQPGHARWWLFVYGDSSFPGHRLEECSSSFVYGLALSDLLLLVFVIPWHSLHVFWGS